MFMRHHFMPRGSKGQRVRHPGQCVLLGKSPTLAFVSDVSGNKAIVDTAVGLDIGERIELHHPVAGVIIGNVVERLTRGVAIAFNAGDRAVAFALTALARDLVADPH
jgi:hypothetical protein